jgi:hypothetical protein
MNVYFFVFPDDFPAISLPHSTYIRTENALYRVSLSTGALSGKLEGISLLGLLTEKKKYIWFPFLDTEDIKISSLGAIWNCSKGIELS